ncbi:helix-turn-helix domain-containing protein [Candidatus Margulisiibacteriota bacterium]
MMKKHCGSKSKAAKILGLHRNTLLQKERKNKS